MHVCMYGASVCACVGGAGEGGGQRRAERMQRRWPSARDSATAIEHRLHTHSLTHIHTHTHTHTHILQRRRGQEPSGRAIARGWAAASCSA